jgi:hypothetical protein
MADDFEWAGRLSAKKNATAWPGDSLFLQNNKRNSDFRTFLLVVCF